MTAAINSATPSGKFAWAPKYDTMVCLLFCRMKTIKSTSTSRLTTRATQKALMRVRLVVAANGRLAACAVVVGSVAAGSVTNGYCPSRRH